MGLSTKSVDVENKKFTLTVNSIPDTPLSYPVTVKATLEDGSTVEKTKYVTIKVVPEVTLSGADSFTALNGEGSAVYTFNYTPSAYNASVELVSVTSSNSTIVVSNATTSGFTLSVSGTTADVSGAITAIIKIDGVEKTLTKSVTAKYSEKSYPLVFYNLADGDNTIKINHTYQTQIVNYCIVDNYNEGDIYSMDTDSLVFTENSGYSANSFTLTAGQALIISSTDMTYGWRGNFKAADFSKKTFGITATANFGVEGNLSCYLAEGSSNNYIVENFGTNTAYSDYGCLFYNCTTLIKANLILPITTDKSAFFYMFGGCTSLVQAPIIRATVAYSDQYYGIFYGCSSLAYIKNMLKTVYDTSQVNPVYNAVYGVASTGTYVGYSDSTASMCPSNWTKEYIDE